MEESYYNWKQMSTYNNSVSLNNKLQKAIIDYFGIDNMRRFEQETGFFSRNAANILYNANNSIYFSAFCKNNKIKPTTYDEFTDLFAKFLLYLKKKFYRLDYDFIEGPFRDNHPELFIAKDAPEELKKAFYNNQINADFFRKHRLQNYTHYFLDKDLEAIIGGSDFHTIVIDPVTNERHVVNFIAYYSKRFGNKEMLKLLETYGHFFNSLLDFIIRDSYTKQEIDDAFKRNVYNKICYNCDIDYNFLTFVDDFVKDFPNIFIDFTKLSHIPYERQVEISKFIPKYYSRQLEYDDIKKYPELVSIFKDKKIDNWFRPHYQNDAKYFISNLGQELFLELCSIYGNHLKTSCDYNTLINNSKDENNNISKTKLKENIENTIAYNCLNGLEFYTDKYAPDFLKINYPELFLSDDAPEDLKNHFYKINCNGLTFSILKDNPEWLPYLENKNYVASFYYNINKEEVKKYFDFFGEDALKQGIKKPETVERMLRNNLVDLMKEWYDKTGRKYIPDYVVMENFPINEADNFFDSINYWNKLMKLESYANNSEAREAMLKLSYSFGVFHSDVAGFQKIYSLLADIPHYLNEEEVRYIYNNFEKTKNDFFGEEKYYEIKKSLIKEGLKIDDDQNIINHIYKKNEDGSYTLAIDQQKFPKSKKLIRELMNNQAIYPIIGPNILHNLFGGFKMEYDKEFREFLLNNLEDICEFYYHIIGNIQRQFKQIKAINSNRVLTLDLATKFIESQNYENIILGNEKMAEISAIAGYSQEDFNTLQQIYNYGRMRIFSSIPRISNKTEKYTYEILRLDDPLALAIGTLTNCCQELHNAAETCMIHSMVDVNGRIFVIRDIDGNIVSQSWVWRNKDVLCFDNIEIPGKAFKRAELNKEDFAKEVYDIYKQASKELMEEDEKVYKQLLDDGKITKEQYDGLRLGKVTVGLGYNDIANAIRENSIKDNNISSPIDFKSPLDLNKSLYTNDSKIQYVLEERKDRKEYIGDNLYVHNDLYQIYDHSNITEKELNILIEMDLEAKSSNTSNLSNIYYEKRNIIEGIADIYNLNPKTTKIILQPNFAIIYDDNDNKITIGDLFFITNIDKIDIKDVVITQIHLALIQISKNKNINFDNLNDSQKEMLNKALNLDDKFDNLKSKR